MFPFWRRPKPVNPPSEPPKNTERAEDILSSNLSIVQCRATDCLYNMRFMGTLGCFLKTVWIDGDGKCHLYQCKYASKQKEG